MTITREGAAAALKSQERHKHCWRVDGAKACVRDDRHDGDCDLVDTSRIVLQDVWHAGEGASVEIVGVRS